MDKQEAKRQGRQVQATVGRDFTVSEVVALAKRKGELQVNPLRYRKSKVTDACFKAAKLGLLNKRRINAGFFIFTPNALGSAAEKPSAGTAG